MKKTLLPSDFYSTLYEKIIDAAREHEINDVNDKTFFFGVEKGNLSVGGVASMPVKWCDDSFDHLFGIFHDGHFEHDLDAMPVIDEITVYDDDDNELEIDLEKFYKQFDVREVSLPDGHVLKHGDIVGVTFGRIRMDAVFDHYNTKTHEYHCRGIYGNCQAQRPYGYKPEKVTIPRKRQS